MGHTAAIACFESGRHLFDLSSSLNLAVFASPSPSDPFAVSARSAIFEDHGAMFGSTAQRYGLQRANAEDVTEGGKQSARGKEHAHLDASVTAVRRSGYTTL